MGLLFFCGKLDVVLGGMDATDVYELQQLFSIAKAQRHLYAGMTFLASNIALSLLLPFESGFSWIEIAMWVVPVVTCFVLKLPGVSLFGLVTHILAGVGNRVARHGDQRAIGVALLDRIVDAALVENAAVVIFASRIVAAGHHERGARLSGTNALALRVVRNPLGVATAGHQKTQQVHRPSNAVPPCSHGSTTVPALFMSMTPALRFPMLEIASARVAQ